MKTGEKIKHIREAKKISREALSKKMNTTGHTLYRLERGDMQITEEWLNKYAKALGVNVTELIGNIGSTSNGNNNDIATDKFSPILKRKLVSVVGIVGAGQKVYPIDDYAKGDGLREVDCPPGLDPDYIVALLVEGDSMSPKYEKGDIIYYRRDVYGMNGECLNKYCVVALADGSLMVKQLKTGNKKGTYNLESVNAETIKDVDLLWCAKILFVKPS